MAMGTSPPREAFLADLLSRHLTIDPYTVEDFSIRRYGDVALLSGTSRLTGRFQGKKFVSHYRLSTSMSAAAATGR